MSLTSVTLGNFFTTSNGKTVLGGAGGSGLDTQSLINSLTAAQSAPATQDQTQITANNKKTTAFGTLQSLLSTFQSAADAIRNPPGVNNSANNVFDFTTGSVGNGGSSYVSVTTTPGANLQTYNISNISSIATAASQTTGSFNVASADASVVPPSGGSVAFGAGTITFNGQQIEVDSGDSLNTIAAKFNTVSGSTGVTATVIQVDSTHFELSFTATATGTNANFNLSGATDPSGVLTNAGLSAPVSGTNAIFELNGVTITRQSNTVSDAVNGLTFNILQKTPDNTTIYPVSIQADTTTIQNSIVNFVNAYNAIKTFQAQQTQLNSNGTFASTAILANDPTFQSIINNVNQEVNSQVAGIAGNNPSSLADVGITFTNQPATSTAPEVDNILTVNDGQLTSALSSNFKGVENLFGFNLTSNNANLQVFTHTNALSATNFTLNIDPVSNTFTATVGSSTINLTAQAISGGLGYTLTGPAGSALDGLELIYGSTSAATINVTTTSGIADQAYNSTQAALAQNTGTIAIATQALTTSNTKLNQDIQNVNAQVAIYQQQLIQKFSALEQAISKVDTVLQNLNANQNAALTASGH